MTLTDPAHPEAAQTMREQFRALRSVAVGDDRTRDLADFDRAFGIGGKS